ncbi:MAG: cadherin repeat domain-containing protein, partial [Bacteroidota bacterium]
VFLQKLTFAVAPSWSVNPAAFAYSMTVTAVAEINCTELTSPSNRIGAFVGSDCRGTALTSTVVNGRYIASMVVYSNVPSGETITFKIYNVANDSVYDAKTTAAFQDNAAFGVSSSPFVTRNNNAPTALNLNVQNINEGQPTNTTVGALSTTDIDPAETFTYTLVSGTGSTDNSNFAISGSNLVTNVVLNYATKTSHSIRVKSTDANGCSFERTFTITVNDVNTAPTGIIISDSTINENSTSLTVLGSLSAIDYDAGENFTYSLVSGTGSTDNGSFNINGSNLRSLSSFNYEVKSSYSIRVRVTDVASNSFERIITVLVKDVNDVPTSIDINGSTTGISFAENKPLGTVIGLIHTTDEDAGNSFIYTFVNTAGNNNDKFTIAGNQLRTNDLFDYEVRQNYVIFLQANDGNGGLLTRQFSLTVTDSNDAPTSMSLTSSNINENLPASTFIGKITTIDPDVSSSFTYTLVTGAGSGGNGNFRISADSLYSSTPFDYESVTSYSIRVNVNDGSNGSYQQTFNINILNANDAPTDINLTSNQIAENQPANAIVGTLSTNDQDLANTFVYTLVGGTGSTDNSSFNISGSSLRASSSFDYETKNAYSIRLKTTDNQGAYFEKVFTINVTNVSDAPTNITLTNDTISENRALNTLIGTLESVSQDTALTFTYSFDNNVTGNNNSSFTLTGSQLRSNSVFDYESKNSYFVYIISNDGAGGTFTKQFQVNIINRNDAPTDIVVNNRSIAENAAIQTFISRVTSVDPDNNTTFTYSLVTGAGDNDNSSFTLRADSLFASASFDFETKNVYSTRIQTNDNLGGIFQKIITINVTNINDNPTNVTLSEVSINENLAANTTVGTFTATDQDTGNTFIYSLVAGAGNTDNGSFVISGTSLRSSATFDYEVKSSYSIRVRVTDNFGGMFEKQFTISINNLNDAPTNIALSNDTITENKALNSLIGTFTTTDQDVNSFTYSFASVAGNNNASFTISGNQLRTNAVFNYEALSTYFIYVQTNDGNGGTFVKQFQINIKDTNDAPSDLLISNNT